MCLPDGQCWYGLWPQNQGRNYLENIATAYERLGAIPS